MIVCFQKNLQKTIDMIENDKSTIPAKEWCKEIGFKVIDEFNDGKTYQDVNGKLHNKKNCFFSSF